jgi:hypothetical protein
VGEAAKEVVERTEEGAPLALHASHMLARLGLAFHQPLEPPMSVFLFVVLGLLRGQLALVVALAACDLELLEGGAEAAGQWFGLELHGEASRRPGRR